MQFINGLHRDTSEVNQPQNTWRDAQNILLSKGFKSLENEEGNSLIGSISTSSILGALSTGDEIVLISLNASGDNEIYRYDGVTFPTNPVVIADFGFTEHHTIEGVFKYLNNGDLIIAITDDNVPPYLLNLDDLPFKSGLATGTYYLANPNELTCAYLFPEMNFPLYYLKEVSDIDGGLLSGTYYVCLRYGITEYDFIGWTNVSAPIFIVADTAGIGFTDYGGCEPGTLTSKSFTITLSNLDTRFQYFELAVLYENNSTFTAYKTKLQYFASSNLNVTISSLENLTSINYEDTITPTVYYDKVKTITSLDGRLLLGNLESDETFDYQKYASGITCYWIADGANLDHLTDSNKDPVYLFNHGRGFFNDEIYALYGAWIYKNGTKGKPFIIPGREENSGDTDVEVDANITAIDTTFSFKKFHVSNTATKDVTHPWGQFGYWENTDENYPDTEDFEDVTLVPYTFRDLTNQPVLHHKFPSLRQLWWEPTYAPNNRAFITNSAPTSIKTYFGDFGTPYVDETPAPLGLGFANFTNSNCPVGNFAFDSVKKAYYYEIPTDGKIEIWLNLRGTIVMTSPITGVTQCGIGWHLYYWDGSANDLIPSTVEYGAIGEIFVTESINYHGLVNVSAGDKIYINFFLGEAGNITYYYKKILGSINFKYITEPTLVGGSMYTETILGVKLSDIPIPDDIKGKVQGLELYYAKRKFGNSSVICNSEWDRWRITSGVGVTPIHTDFGRANYALSAPFDLFQNDLRPNITPTHMMNIGYSDDYYVSGTTNYTGSSLTNVIGVDLDNTEYKPRDLTSEYISTHYQLTPDSHYPDDGTHHYIYMNLYSFHKNCYNRFYEQELVGTGNYFPVSDDDTNLDEAITFHGDCFTGLIGERRDFFRWLDPFMSVYTNLYRCYFFPSQMANNGGLRSEGSYDGTSLLESYVPKEFVDKPTTTTSVFGATQLIRSDEPTSKLYFDYNRDYSDLCRFIKNILYSPFETLIYNYPYRIHQSITKIQESLDENWRTFLALDYYDMPYNKAEVIAIRGLNKILHISQERSYHIARLKDILQVQNVDAYLGTGDLFDRLPEEIRPSDIGTIGNTSQHATIITPYGIVLVDRLAGRVFLINNEAHEISAIGLRDYLKDAFISTTATYIDSPLSGEGVTVGWDDEYERILVTQNQAISDLDYGTQFTLSFYPKFKVWVSYHSYIPNFYVWMKKGLYTIVNNSITTNGELYKQNNLPYARGEFYGQQYDSYIEVVFNSPDEATKLFKSATWETDVFDSNGISQWDETFTSIMIYTKNQCSGEIAINVQDADLDDKNTKFLHGKFIINQIYDFLLKSNSQIINPVTRELTDDNLIYIDPITDTTDGIIQGVVYEVYDTSNSGGTDYITYPVVAGTNYDTDFATFTGGATSAFTITGNAKLRPYQQWYEQTEFIDKFIVVRFIYDNSNRLIINDLDANLKVLGKND